MLVLMETVTESEALDYNAIFTRLIIRGYLFAIIRREDFKSYIKYISHVKQSLSILITTSVNFRFYSMMYR
jgi:hypothetical protein